MKTSLEGLLARLEEAAHGLPGVTRKRMFGCDALFADGSIFGLVWKHGRIGVRLPQEELYSTLMDRKGAAPWKAGDMTMAHWVLVPEAFHDAPRALGEWVKWAHGLALGARGSAPKKPPAKAKAAGAKPIKAATKPTNPTKKASSKETKTAQPAARAKNAKKTKSAAPAKKARKR